MLNYKKRGDQPIYEYFVMLVPYLEKLLYVQVSLVIRGGYVPYNSRTANTKTSIFGLFYTKNSSFHSLFAVFGDFLSLRIVKTANTKTANSKGRLYCFIEELSHRTKFEGRSLAMQDINFWPFLTKLKTSIILNVCVFVCVLCAYICVYFLTS